MALHLLCQCSEIWPELLPQRTKKSIFANMFCLLLQGLERHSKSTLHPCVSSITKEKKGKMMKLILKKYGFAVTAKYTYKFHMPSGPVNLRIFGAFRADTLHPGFYFTILGGRGKRNYKSHSTLVASLVNR